MKTFQIEIKEAVRTVQAETLEQAIAIVKDQYVNEEILLDVNYFVEVEFSSVMDSEIIYTTDTLRPLTYGEELFFNEETGDYYDSWLAMIRDACIKV